MATAPTGLVLRMRKGATVHSAGRQSVIVDASVTNPARWLQERSLLPDLQVTLKLGTVSWTGSLKPTAESED